MHDSTRPFTSFDHCFVQKIYSPRNESELVFVQSLLQAHDVPYVVDQGGFGAAFPGLYIDHFTRKWIKVPDAAVERAQILIRENLSNEAEPEVDADMGWMDKLRIFVEALAFGWFVPGRRGNTRNRNRTE
ncbi:MAG: DUF2007 domain-containing protein [Proteobacteria bacterium]|nr:DUF2007 domain-containing protein [Pseudomonadota bacterium]